MAEYSVNIIPLSSTKCKVNFINYDGIKTDGLTEITYDGNTFQVTQTGVLSEGESFNGWCVVDASFSDFGFNSRVIVEVEGGVTIPLGFGRLYNYYAATDVRGVAPSGFRVPSATDISTLSTTLGGNTVSGGELKSIRTATSQPSWDSPNTGATDSVGFMAFPAGVRGSGGSYSEFGRQFSFMCTTVFGGPPNYYVLNNLAHNNDDITGTGVPNFFGTSIRCVSDIEPSSAIVQDADGNDYTWVQIGSQYWLQQNLRTTKFNNGDNIPTGFNDAAWAALTSAGWAYPNGDSNLPI